MEQKENVPEEDLSEDVIEEDELYLGRKVGVHAVLSLVLMMF